MNSFGMKDEIDLICESMGDLSSFYVSHNIVEEDLGWLGSGEFGEAYETGDGRVVKLTSSESEFKIAKHLIEYNKRFPYFVDIYVAEEIDGDWVIIMEQLDTDGSIEDKFGMVNSYLDELGIGIGEIRYADWDDLSEPPSEDEMKFIDDICGIAGDYGDLGITAYDIHDGNLGYDKEGNVKAFDIEDKGGNWS